MIALPIISFVCCFAYIIYIVYRFEGVPVSLSETYYLLPNRQDWMFAAWTVLTSVPLGFYWYTITTDNWKWCPIVVCLSVVMIGVASRYKSDDKPIEIANQDTIYQKSLNHSNIFTFIKNVLYKFKPSEFFKYGWVRPIHYINSLIAIILSTLYLCFHNTYAIFSTLISYIVFILIGAKIKGVYNKNYSTDVDNSAWIFFMEVVCFLNMFIFLWNV